jgi:hypothetical protein
MPIVSISEAARLVNRHRKTIQRYVADGRISLSQNVSGERGIDTSELIRVFGIFSHDDGALAHEAESQLVQENIPEGAGENVGALKAEIDGLKAVVDSQRSHIASLESAMLLLGHSVKHSETLTRRWWKFWS